MDVLSYAANRLREGQTYSGLALLATAVGIGFSPEQWQAIAAAGTALAGLLQTFLPNLFGARS